MGGPTETPDPSCPSAEAVGTPLSGCCTPEGLCGVISTISGACITQSQFVMLPANPQSCEPPASGDAGTEDPDAGTEDTDAGTEDTDAGTEDTDAGTEDAGTEDAD
jgi:hypothetical protein